MYHSDTFDNLLWLNDPVDPGRPIGSVPVPRKARVGTRPQVRYHRTKGAASLSQPHRGIFVESEQQKIKAL